jgi:hypothetical protein
MTMLITVLAGYGTDPLMVLGQVVGLAHCARTDKLFLVTDSTR